MAQTADSLAASGARPRLPAERLRDAVLERLASAEAKGATRAEAIQELFPEALLDDDVLESVVAALLSGTNLLLIGPPGSGKTSLAKDIQELFPRDSVVVADCAVQDDPFSLLDPVFSARHPACPACRAKHGALSYREIGDFDPRRVDAKKVPVRVARLREGYGFARLQGSPEVFPDYLTGAINLAKLEEIGDPESPLVLEPGKLMQANRGVLIIDEVGKLPRGTQNVLLQALQESIVTPSKSRETFPAAFFCVATSNVDDLEAIEDPLLGRFTSVYVPFNTDHAKNRAIIDRAARDARLVVPALVREAAVLLVERWRKVSAESPELGEVGSNRTMIDLVRRSEAHALLRRGALVGPEDFTRGAEEAMVGRVRGRSAEGYHENREAVQTFLAKQTPKALGDAAMDVWCGFFVGVLKEDKSEGDRVARELLEGARDAKRVEEALRGTSGLAKLRRFAEYVDATEGASLPEDVKRDRLAMLLRAFEQHKTFEAAKK
ncbi:MAG TPA: ATP-binding protein [Candidatus Thermoplasmatota archaeon]|nr:ATP-binding protein [Candidatus Thermoplasmatota archaeon]